MDINGEEILTEDKPLVQYDESTINKQGCLASIGDPRKPFYRYFALIFMCMLGFGSYFCYDNPAALQDHFKKDLQISTSTFTAFYSWYSWPNVILSFVGGYLIDRVFGIRIGALVFGSMVFFGQLIFAFGAFNNHIWLMDIGRFIFG